MKTKKKPVSSMLTGFFTPSSKLDNQNLNNPKSEVIFRVIFGFEVTFRVTT